MQGARAAAKHLLRLMGNLLSRNVDGNNLPGADRLTYHTTALAPDPEAAGTNSNVNTPRCEKPKYAPFHTSMPWGWVLTLKERLDIPSARFRVPKNNKAGFKIAALSCTLWGDSKANHFHLFWTHTKLKKETTKTHQESCQAVRYNDAK